MPKSHRPKRPKRIADEDAQRQQAGADAVTVAWTAAVIAAFLSDSVTVAAHFYARSHPESNTAPVFAAIMLLTASLMGLIALALLPVVWRVSRLKPPLGFAAFAALVAAAPVVVLILRLIDM